MVYDPINGCVRGIRGQDDRFPRRPTYILTETDKQEILENLEAKLKPMDRVDLMEELAKEVPTDAISISNPKNILEVKRGKLRFMIGLQRSGKSTWATEWVRSKPRIKDGILFPRVIVCADNIRLAISGQRYNKHIEPIVFMVKDYMIESLLSRGHDVLVDGTHTTKFSIQQNIKIDHDAQFTLINTPVEICKQRAIDTNQSDLVPVLNRTSRQLQALLDEGISKICEDMRIEIKARYPSHSDG